MANRIRIRMSIFLLFAIFCTSIAWAGVDEVTPAIVIVDKIEGIVPHTITFPDEHICYIPSLDVDTNGTVCVKHLKYVPPGEIGVLNGTTYWAVPRNNLEDAIDVVRIKYEDENGSASFRILGGKETWVMGYPLDEEWTFFWPNILVRENGQWVAKNYNQGGKDENGQCLWVLRVPNENGQWVVEGQIDEPRPYQSASE